MRRDLSLSKLRGELTIPNQFTNSFLQRLLSKVFFGLLCKGLFNQVQEYYGKYREKTQDQNEPKIQIYTAQELQGLYQDKDPYQDQFHKDSQVHVQDQVHLQNRFQRQI